MSIPDHPSLSSSRIEEPQLMASANSHSNQQRYAYVLLRAPHPPSSNIVVGSCAAYHVFHSAQAATDKLLEIHERLCEMAFNSLEMEKNPDENPSNDVATPGSDNKNGNNGDEGFQLGFWAGKYEGLGSVAVYTEDIWIEKVKLSGCIEEEEASMPDMGDLDIAGESRTPVQSGAMDVEMKDVGDAEMVHQTPQMANAMSSNSKAPVPTKAYVVLRLIKPYSPIPRRRSVKSRIIPPQTTMAVHHRKFEAVAALATAPRTWIVELEFEDKCSDTNQTANLPDAEQDPVQHRRARSYEDFHGPLGHIQEPNFVIAEDSQTVQVPLEWIDFGQDDLDWLDQQE